MVATPIGNLSDLSARATDALRGADVIACEDTRHTRKLLAHAGVSAQRLIAVHDHNEASQVRTVLSHLGRGHTVALVSDAGTPAISDPGARLVAAAASAGYRVTVVPGPTAAVSALVVSGLPTGRWVFEGFLPRKGAERASRLAELGGEARTTVLFEAPHRLRATLSDLAGACGELRAVVVARELTKLHEEVWRGNLGQAVSRATEVEPRGEHAIVLAGAPEPSPPTEAEIESSARGQLALGLPLKEAAAAVAAELGISRRRAYAAALRSREAGDDGEPVRRPAPAQNGGRRRSGDR